MPGLRFSPQSVPLFRPIDNDIFSPILLAVH